MENTSGWGGGGEIAVFVLFRFFLSDPLVKLVSKICMFTVGSLYFSLTNRLGNDTFQTLGALLWRLESDTVVVFLHMTHQIGIFRTKETRCINSTACPDVCMIENRLCISGSLNKEPIQ